MALEHYQRHLAKVQPDIEREGALAARLYERNHGPLLPANRDAAIADLGCGFGLFLRYLRGRGYTNITGVDVCANFMDCYKNDSFPVSVEDNLTFARSRPDQFDCITLNYVLEHYDKDSGLELLEAAREALKPGGRVLIVVPNMANPITATRSLFMDITHEVSYTEESLETMLEIAGYSQIDLRPVDQFCLPNPLMNLAGKAAGWCFFKALRVLYLLNAVRSTRIYTKSLLAAATR
jgi:SAM-dependent methyltransferase